MRKSEANLPLLICIQKLEGLQLQTIVYQRTCILRASSPTLRVLLQLKQGFASSLLVKYYIPFLGCTEHVIKSHICDSFLTRVINYGYVDNLA